MSAQSAESVAKLSEARLRQLVDTAAEMKAKAYCPYSNFKVGAALLTKGGHVFTGKGAWAELGSASCGRSRSRVRS